MSDLIRIIYVSCAREEFGDEELDRILQVSVKNNAAADITGMLLYARGSFMQVLEGPAEHVGRIFGEILKDERHHDIDTIVNEPLVAREFAGWAMAFHRITHDDATLHPGFAPLFENGFVAERFGNTYGRGLASELLLNFCRYA